MSKVSDNVLGQIKKSNLKPIPKWHFVLWHIFLILTLIATILAGGLVVSLVFLQLSNLDWEFVSVIGEHGLPPIIKVLPLLWIIMMIVLLFISLKVFSLFENSHKYSHFLVVIASIFLSILLGAFIYATRTADFFEDSLRNHIGPYSEMQEKLEQNFLRPAEGLLPGIIIEIVSPTQFRLMDLKNETWNIDVQPNLTPKNKFQNLKAGQSVMVIGKQKNDHDFTANDLKLKRTFGANLRTRIMKNHLIKPGK